MVTFNEHNWSLSNERRHRYVALCRAAGIPLRDIAFLLGITPQRVSQIGLKDDDD